MFGKNLIFQRSIKRRSNELRIFEIKCVDNFVLDEYILIISLLDSIYALSVMNHGGAATALKTFLAPADFEN